MTRLPNRCLHIMVSGAQCGSPALRHNRFCYNHRRQHEQRLELNADRARNRRNAPFTLPVLEDSDSIQLALTKVMRLLAAGELDRKTASLMLYALQIATTNLQRAALDKLS
jgi:hypothetical protein